MELRSNQRSEVWKIRGQGRLAWAGKGWGVETSPLLVIIRVIKQVFPAVDSIALLLSGMFHLVCSDPPSKISCSQHPPLYDLNRYFEETHRVEETLFSPTVPACPSMGEWTIRPL
jgi:hypothetical protein